VELILEAGDQRIYTFTIEVLQACSRRNLLGIAEKPVDQIVEDPEPEQGGASILGRHSQNMLETSIDGVSRIYRSRDPLAFSVLDANNVEKKTGICRRNVFHHHRKRFPLLQVSDKHGGSIRWLCQADLSVAALLRGFTIDAKNRIGNSFKSLLRDFFPAAHTYPVVTVLQPPQR
jgi:hypothetical protein